MPDHPTPWRTGRRVARNLYDANDQDIGRMDTPELAERVVAAVNAAEPATTPDYSAAIRMLRAIQNIAQMPASLETPEQKELFRRALPGTGTWIQPELIGECADMLDRLQGVPLSPDNSSEGMVPA